MRSRVVRSLAVLASVVTLAVIVPSANAVDAPSSCSGTISTYDTGICSFAFKGYPIVLEGEFTPSEGAMRFDTWELHLEAVLRWASNVEQAIGAECAETGTGTVTCRAVIQPNGPGLPAAVPPALFDMTCYGHLHDLRRVDGAYGTGTFGCSSGGQA